MIRSDPQSCLHNVGYISLSVTPDNLAAPEPCEVPAFVLPRSVINPIP